MIKKDEDLLCVEVSVNYESAKTIQQKRIQKTIIFVN